MSRVVRQETFTILFLMRKGRRKKNGLASVYARITTGSLRQESYFHCEGKPELWNQKKERMMNTNLISLKVNEMLDEFRVQILDIRSKLLAEGFAANTTQIKQRYLNPTCNTMMLIAGLTDYAKRRQGEEGVRITQRTADKYERLLRYLKQYLAQRGNAEDIPVERMNYKFPDGFNLFLQTAHRYRHNGTVAVMDCLRNFALYCLRNEWITKNPFRYYKLKEDEVQAKEHLTAHELELLTRKALDHRLARIRDVFVFCCFSGLSYSDVKKLTFDNIKTSFDGDSWIIAHRQKTGTPFHIKLLPIAKQLIENYRPISKNNLVFPVPSVCDNMNRTLQRIARDCRLKKHITMHAASHTFATTVTLSQDLPLETVSQMLGHTNTLTTQIYAKITNKKISRNMSALTERLGNQYRLAE